MEDHELSFKLGELIITLTSLLEDLVIVGESNLSTFNKQVLLNDIVRLQLKIGNINKQLEYKRK